jgi:O-antigen/teichoic acid export membrane protein
LRVLQLALGYALITRLQVPEVVKLFIKLLYGAKYDPSAGILKVHIWTALFVFMLVVIDSGLVIEDLIHAALIMHSAGAISNVVLNLYLIPMYGGYFAATLILYAISSYLFLFAYQRLEVLQFKY